MGKLIAKNLVRMKWDLAGCLLFLGFAAPAFHQFYGSETTVSED